MNAVSAKDIIVEFSGWVRITPSNLRFQLITDEEEPEVITGVEWLALDEETRGDYVLEDFIAAQRDADDGELVDLQVFEDDTF